MKKYHLILLSIFSGILFSIGWPVNGFPVFLFFSFVPLLYIEDFICKNKKNFSIFSILFYSYPAFFVWNLLTTWWIWNSTETGAIMAILLNSLFMAVFFNLYHITKRILYKNDQGYFILIFYWITWEFLHLDWDLSWSWLNLGNGFASYTKWIQWYEFTGTFGGTFWILLVNIIIYKLLVELLTKNKSLKKIIVLFSSLLLLIFLPIIFSYIIYNNYEETKNPVSVVVVQPNIDPYSEQYNLPPSIIIDKIFKLAEPEIDSLTDFVVCPESANQEDIWERNIKNYPSIIQLKKFIKKYPHINFVIGASTYKRLEDEQPITNAARKFHDSDNYYYAYNTVIFLDSSDIIRLYHKSKLTPGVEKMPSWKILKPLEKFAIDLGGTIGTLATDKEKKVFNTKDSLKVAVIICYESVYGEFVSEFVRNGANLIFLITNDGWWGNTPGHRQHFSFSPLRAIETRRSFARSANTGISCFINQKGDVFQKTEYWVPAVIKQDINANSKLTFYVKYGDYIGRISAFISALFFLITISMGIVNRKKSLQLSAE
ncbi:MAG: apolipoprotein N-acyltransferase [Bacteroidales bacterium]|nr:apolipoprotein N-acyltransferase [Bacteroidales bacterium]